MATTTINTEPLDRLIGQVNSLADVDFEPLMLEFELILNEDNRAGALAGLDGWGQPLAPVTYRPDPTAGTGKRRTPLERPNNNLSTTAYRMLDGPPLAPRYTESRIINNFMTTHQREGGAWVAIGAWADVVSISGVPFLGAHFRGEGNLPVRNLAHVRPTAMARAKVALHDFAVALISRIRGQS